MKLGRGWTQSPPGIAYHETSVFFKRKCVSRSSPFLNTILFVSVWLVLVVVCIQSEHSALPCWVWLTTSSFAIAGVIRPRFSPAIRCQQLVGDAGRRVLLLRAICICVHFGELTVVFAFSFCRVMACFVCGLFLPASPHLRSSLSTALCVTRCSRRYLKYRN